MGPGGLLDRDKPPRWYLDRPIMSDWVQANVILTAFFALDTTRPRGAMGGIFSIPWDQVMYYADRLGLDPESAIRFWEIIRDTDALYVREANKRISSRAEATPRGNRAALPRRETTR